MTQIRSQCMFCRWFKRDKSGGCDAFPDEMPMQIFLNEMDHRKPYPGDSGIRWELAPDAPEGTVHPMDPSQQ